MFSFSGRSQEGTEPRSFPPDQTEPQGHYTVAPGVEISPTGPSRWDGSRGEESASGGEEDECG